MGSKTTQFSTGIFFLILFIFNGPLYTEEYNLSSNKQILLHSPKVLNTNLRRIQRLTQLKMDVLEKVIDVVSESLEVEPSKIKPESSFVEDLGADSLQTLDVVMSLEDKFNIKIEDSDTTKIHTVQQAVDYINKAMKQNS